MKTAILVVVALCLAMSPIRAQAPKTLRISVIGVGNLPAWFIEDMKSAQAEAGLSLEFVPRSDDRLNYVITVNQIGSLANVVIALNPGGEVAASVVKSGRISARGVMEDSARELAKKLAALPK